MIKRMDKEILAKYHQGRLIVRKYHQGRLYYATDLWLKGATQRAIRGAFGARDGATLIAATNAYLNALAATDRTKATALAGFINTYAIEDAYVVVSIIPTTGYKRYVVGSGSQYFTTAVSVSQNFKFDMHIVLTGTTCGILGYNYGTRATRIFYLPGTLYAAFARADANTSRYPNSVTLTTGTEYHIEFDGTKLYLDGVELGITTGTDYMPSQNIQWFVEDNRYGYFKGKELKLTDSENKEHWYVPFKRNGVMELLDLETGTLATRVGTFTESFTLQDGVTPWTPSTP